MPELFRRIEKEGPPIPSSFWRRNGCFITALMIVILPIAAYGINRFLVEYGNLKGAREFMGKIHSWFKNDLEIRASTLGITACALPCIGIYVDSNSASKPSEEREKGSKEKAADRRLPLEQRMVEAPNGMPLHTQEVSNIFETGYLEKNKNEIKNEIRGWIDSIEQLLSKMVKKTYPCQLDKEGMVETLFSDLSTGVCGAYATFWMRKIEDAKGGEVELQKMTNAEEQTLFEELVFIQLSGKIIQVMQEKLVETGDYDNGFDTAILKLLWQFSYKNRVFIPEADRGVEECQQLLSKEKDLHLFISASNEKENHRMFIYSKGGKHYFCNNNRLYIFSTKENLIAGLMRILAANSWNRAGLIRRLSEEHHDHHLYKWAKAQEEIFKRAENQAK